MYQWVNSAPIFLISTTLNNLHMSRQRLEVILENKVPKKLKFSKNANNKKCAPKMILFKGKK
jgi:hypothetical protein